MSAFSMWKRTLTVENTVVEGVRIDENEQRVIVMATPVDDYTTEYPIQYSDDGLDA